MIEHKRAPEAVPEPTPTPVAVAEPPVHGGPLDPAQILAVQRAAGNAALARVLARQAAAVPPAPAADPALPPAHVLDSAEPKILGLAGGQVRLLVGGRETAVSARDFGENWQPRGSNPATAESNYWYRIAWEQIVSGSGMPVKSGAVAPDKGLSVELEDAPEAETSAQRVLLWLQQHKDLIAAAEARHKVDRRAIAGAIAWEALENVRGAFERAAGRFEGPGKVHVREGKVGVAAVDTGTIVAKEVEEKGILPAATTSERAKLLQKPEGSIEYVAGTMRLGAEIASEFGFDISGDPRALCFFFNAMDSAKWRARLKDKPKGSEFTFSEPITDWMGVNLPFLEKAVGTSALRSKPVAEPGPEPEPDPEELRKRTRMLAFSLAELVVAADERGAQSIDITVTRRGGNLEPAITTSDEPRYVRPPNRVGMSMASALAKLEAPMGLLAGSTSVHIRFERLAAGWMEMSIMLATSAQAPAGGVLARTPADAPATEAPKEAPKAEPAAEPTITYRSKDEEDGMTAEALTALKAILTTAGITSAQISSVARDSAAQASAMYYNLEGSGKGQGVEAQRGLYAAPGDKVIDVYEALKKEKKTPEEIKAGMKEKIDEVGASNVTQHAADTAKVCVFDVGPASIPSEKHAKLSEAAKAEVGKSLVKFIPYPADPGFHFEVGVAATVEAAPAAPAAAAAPVPALAAP